jgi:hypothetical protein
MRHRDHTSSIVTGHNIKTKSIERPIRLGSRLTSFEYVSWSKFVLAHNDVVARHVEDTSGRRRVALVEGTSSRLRGGVRGGQTGVGGENERRPGETQETRLAIVIPSRFGRSPTLTGTHRIRVSASAPKNRSSQTCRSRYDHWT